MKLVIYSMSLIPRLVSIFMSSPDSTYDYRRISYNIAVSKRHFLTPLRLRRGKKWTNARLSETTQRFFYY